MLTAEETNILNALPDDLKDYAEAQMHQKVKDYSLTTLKNLCVDIIVQFYKDTNTKNVTKLTLESQRDELINAFKGANKDLTIEEGKRAFKMGVALEFGQYFGGCYKTYVQFLNGYRTKPERERSIKQFLAHIKPAQTSEKPLTIKEQTYKSKEACIYFFEEYKKTGVIPAGSFQIYDFILTLGLIKWTDEEKKEISEPIKAKYLEEIEWSYKKRVIGHSAYEDLKKNLNTNATFMGRVRKAALKRYFDNCISTNYDIVKELGG